MTYLCFRLSMPNIGSWNGKWSGNNDYYAITRRFYIKDKDKVERILSKTNYFYRWDDGWTARISINVVTAKESAEIKKRSKGFFGYQWMADSIIEKGVILTPKEQEAQG